MDSTPWLVSLHSTVAGAEREGVDRRAARVVTEAFARACQDPIRAPRAFDLAVEAYRKQYPAIPSHIAGHAVADILARHEERVL